MLGKTLITHQTGSIGRKCNEVFLVEKIFLRKELYLSLTLDRAQGKMAIITSQKGGMSVEDVEASKMFTFNFELES
jgi:succinyl-CoA synthetase beta subunit